MALSESEVRTFEFRYIDFVMDFIVINLFSSSDKQI